LERGPSPLAKPLPYVENVFHQMSQRLHYGFPVPSRHLKGILTGMAVLVFLALPALAQTDGVGVVVIDPGHGGYDQGITEGIKEKDVTLSVAKEMGDILEEDRKKAFLTRMVDRYLSISERFSIANEKAPDVFLSLHLSDSDGFVVYVTWYEDTEAEMTLKRYYSLTSRQRRYIYESKALQAVMEEALGKEFGLKVAGRQLPLPVLNTISAPAVLVEMPSRGVTYDEATVRRVAHAIVRGILLYEQR
jgi:N-acetylmuramoyl-L-alanine amidase